MTDELNEMSHSLNLCVIFPCYNEEKRLKIDELSSFISSHPAIHFSFVNDGSSDNTLGVLTKLTEGHENSFVLNIENNGGKASAIRIATLKALEEGYQHVGYFDADLATPLDEIIRFLKVFDNKKIELAMGTRILRLGGDVRRKWYRHLLGRLFATCASMSLKLPVYDTQCGAKFFKADLAKKLFQVPFISYWIFDVELLFRMKVIKTTEQMKESIYELPLNKWADEEGSKLGIIDFLKAPIELLRIILHYRQK